MDEVQLGKKIGATQNMQLVSQLPLHTVFPFSLLVQAAPYWLLTKQFAHPPCPPSSALTSRCKSAIAVQSKCADEYLLHTFAFAFRFLLGLVPYSMS